MAAEPTAKNKAWALFDRIVDDAAPGGEHSNPWTMGEDDELRYVPDYDTLARLLGVPLHLGAASRTGVPALALDVWLSYELRRSGFDADATWPRATSPRILPAPVANLLRALPGKERRAIGERLAAASSVPGVTSSSASILGKNYFKQVDVIMTDWATGPELLISTKRMDSSYGKNAANRVEESYGDAKNLRLRHPLAALGFVFALRADILHKEPDTADWLIDLLKKLGREDDAYHATCLVMIDYDDTVAPAAAEADEEPENPLVAAGVTEDPDADGTPIDAEAAEITRALSALPRVTIRHDAIPAALTPARFLAEMVARVLDAAPVNLHKEVRRRRRTAPPIG
ncbi:hypothetical protein [Microbacterium esteraromaticum]|uniref:hypothetical protein n=1 Tax=Microbacterium esteraromaticum TaxID=57043 RepID=UPI0028F6FA7D|nr:hypothetical protein [Microbacterium esteraromaticum]